MTSLKGSLSNFKTSHGETKVNWAIPCNDLTPKSNSVSMAMKLPLGAYIVLFNVYFTASGMDLSYSPSHLMLASRFQIPNHCSFVLF